MRRHLPYHPLLEVPMARFIGVALYVATVVGVGVATYYQGAEFVARVLANLPK